MTTWIHIHINVYAIWMGIVYLDSWLADWLLFHAQYSWLLLYKPYQTPDMYGVQCTLYVSKVNCSRCCFFFSSFSRVLVKCASHSPHITKNIKYIEYHRKTKQYTVQTHHTEDTKHNFIYIEIYRFMRLIRRLSKSSTPSFIHSRHGECVFSLLMLMLMLIR